MIIIKILFKEWVLGKPIGLGGFGELYLASLKLPSGQLSPENYVIKVCSFVILKGTNNSGDLTY